MKKLTLALFVVFSFCQVRADNWLDNGDFTDGINHWHGNGQAPADFAPSNPFDKPDPFTSKGMIMTLKDHDWRKVEQDFKGKLASGVVTITYMVSKDLSFSDKLEDYENMPGHIDYNAWAPFNTPPGSWVMFLSDFGSAHGYYSIIKPKLGSSDVQTFKEHVSGLTPLEDKTITLAFPPGQGQIVILSVSITE